MICLRNSILILLIQLVITSGQQASSQRVGFNNAKTLWDTGRFQCNLAGVLDFWTAIKNETFKDCDTTYFLNQQRIEACKEGAANFVREKADSCSTESDCQSLGDIAASAVSEQFCRIVTKAAMSSAFFPPVCQRSANRQCNIEGKLAIEKLANQRQCGTVSLPLKEAQTLVLQSECREFVRDWARTSLLPFP